MSALRSPLFWGAVVAALAAGAACCVFLALWLDAGDKLKEARAEIAGAARDARAIETATDAEQKLEVRYETIYRDRMVEIERAPTPEACKLPLSHPVYVLARELRDAERAGAVAAGVDVSTLPSD